MQKAKLNFPLFFLVGPADNPTPPTNTPSDGANIVLRSGTITDGMLWDISLNCRTGYYVIKPKSSLSTNTVLGSIQITAEEAINGSALALQQYYDNSVYNDEWNIYPVDCRITVYHYFDLAFRNQYGEDFYEDVNILHLKMAEFFLQEYRLLLPATYTSYVSAGDRGETTVSKGIRDEMVDIYIYKRKRNKQF